MCAFEFAGARCVRAGECAAFHAEEFGLDEFARQRRTIDGDEGLFLACAQFMQCAGEALLADTGFAEEQD